jgi:hypothetical protein
VLCVRHLNIGESFVNLAMLQMFGEFGPRNCFSTDDPDCYASSPKRTSKTSDPLDYDPIIDTTMICYNYGLLG